MTHRLERPIAGYIFNLIFSALRSIGLAVLLTFLTSVGFSQVLKLEYSVGVMEHIPESFVPLADADFTQHSSFWVRVTVTSEEDGQAMLKAGNWYMQQVSFFDSAGIRFYTGNHTKITLKKGDGKFYLYYPFADDKNKNGVTITVDSLQHFLESKITVYAWQYVFASMMGLLCLLSCTYSIIIRPTDKVYVHYACYLFTILIFFLYQCGILGEAVPIISHIQPAWIWIFSNFITITYLFFSQSFLTMKQVDPLLYKTFDWIKYVLTTFVITEAICYWADLDVLHSFWFKAPILLFELVVFPFVFYRVYRMKTTLSWLLLISTIILGGVNVAGQFASTLKNVSLTNYFIQAGMLTDAFIFSVGIAIRFANVNREKQKIQNDLIAQLKINEKAREQNATELESKVAERTQVLNERNHENELLLKEIHHRVKNNLQVVSSLLNISERKIKDEQARQPFRDSANRINTMGLIHSFLYQSDNFSNIDLKKYISQLLGMLVDSFQNKYPDTQITLDVGAMKLDMDRAIEIGLIINELVTNSLKHGVYANNKPVIQLSLQQAGGKLSLRVADNGLLNGHQEINTEATFGMRMITALVKKLNGTVSIEQASGFEVKIIFDESS